MPRVEDLPNPPEIRSRDGLLQATLTAAPARITVAGRTFTSNALNGRYTAPTLRVRRGDRVQLRYVNRTGPADIQLDAGQPTNLHYHGMTISPREPADNIYLMIPPKGGMPPGHAGHIPAVPSGRVRTDAASGLSCYDFDWRVPPTQPQGTYWYHPHAHGFVEDQVLSGMAGMLIVEGLVEEQYPELLGARERIMQLKDIVLPGAPDEAPKTKTINGLAEAPVRIRPGEIQLWRLGNIGANSFFDLTVAGHSFWVLARDGNRSPSPCRPTISSSHRQPGSRWRSSAAHPAATPSARARSIPARRATRTPRWNLASSSWRPGHWTWRNGWVWTPGRYVERPHPEAVWVPGHWI